MHALAFIEHAQHALHFKLQHNTTSTSFEVTCCEHEEHNNNCDAEQTNWQEHQRKSLRASHMMPMQVTQASGNSTAMSPTMCMCLSLQ